MSVTAIDWALRKVKGVTATQKLILICLANHAGPDGSCWPAQKTLASYSGLARQTINRTLSELENSGLISSLRQKDKAGRDIGKLYRLEMADSLGVSESDTGVSKSDTRVSESDTGVSQGDRGGVSQGDTGVTQGDTEPSCKSSKREPSCKPRGKVAILENPLPDQVGEDLWIDFIEHRRALNSPLTESSVHHLAHELLRLMGSGNDPEEVIRQTIIRGWKGVFPLQTREKKGAAGGRQKTFDEIRRENTKSAKDRVLAQMKGEDDGKKTFDL